MTFTTISTDSDGTICTINATPTSQGASTGRNMDALLTITMVRLCSLLGLHERCADNANMVRVNVPYRYNDANRVWKGTLQAAFNCLSEGRSWRCGTWGEQLLTNMAYIMGCNAGYDCIEAAPGTAGGICTGDTDCNCDTCYGQRLDAVAAACATEAAACTLVEVETDAPRKGTPAPRKGTAAWAADLSTTYHIPAQEAAAELLRGCRATQYRRLIKWAASCAGLLAGTQIVACEAAVAYEPMSGNSIPAVRVTFKHGYMAVTVPLANVFAGKGN